MYLVLVCERTRMNEKEDQFDKLSFFFSLLHFTRIKEFIFFSALQMFCNQNVCKKKETCRSRKGFLDENLAFNSMVKGIIIHGKFCVMSTMQANTRTYFRATWYEVFQL